MKSYHIPGGSNTMLFVEECGNPLGIPVLFVHGVSQSRLSWTKQMKSPSLKHLRLIFFDLRGHGLSDKPYHGYHDESNWANDINAIISYLNLNRTVLVGWSYGGKVVCDYIRLYGEDNVSGINLVAAGTSAGISGGSYYTADSQAVIPKLISTDALESSNTLQKFVKLLFYVEPSTEDFYFTLGYNTVVPPYVREAVVTRAASYEDILSKMKIPVLLTHGLQDKILNPSQTVYNSKLILNSTVSFYEGTGHSPFWEKPHRFNCELETFVKKCRL